ESPARRSASTRLTSAGVRRFRYGRTGWVTPARRSAARTVATAPPYRAASAGAVAPRLRAAAICRSTAGVYTTARGGRPSGGSRTTRSTVVLLTPNRRATARENLLRR